MPIGRISLSLFVTFMSLAVQSHGADGPWRLTEALGLPEGFSISGTQRTRAETLSNNVRLGSSKNDEVVTFQTLLNTSYQKDSFGFQVEFIDARQALADYDSLTGADAVNTLDILQANISYRFGTSNNSRVKVGRLTADYGSRRLVSRHRFGNSINAFDGIEYQRRGKSGYELRLLASQPVRRLPSNRIEARTNDRESDKSSSAQQFYAAFLTLPDVMERTSLDLFALAMRESDSAKVNTRNRDHETLGFRLLRAPAVEQYNFELESVYQNGSRRASTSPFDRIDLDHEAYYQYAMLGYSLPGLSRTRVMLEYSYASGDKNPFDTNSESYDSLFGVTTFEFGPTGLYGVLDRHNISTPGVRVVTYPKTGVELMLSYRHFWLAEARDSLGRTGRQDASGRTDNYVGQHLEARVRWDVMPGNLRIESGGAWLHTENLADENTLYAYAAATFRF